MNLRTIIYLQCYNIYNPTFYPWYVCYAKAIKHAKEKAKATFKLSLTIIMNTLVCLYQHGDSRQLCLVGNIIAKWMGLAVTS